MLSSWWWSWLLTTFRWVVQPHLQEATTNFVWFADFADVEPMSVALPHPIQDPWQWWNESSATAVGRLEFGKGVFRFVPGIDLHPPFMTEDAIYIEVLRRSVGPSPIFEPFGGGWWHFETRGSGIFLKAPSLVMDYTCSAWAIHVNDNHTVIELPHFRARCVGPGNAWCFPEDCVDSEFNASTKNNYNDVQQLRRPAYWLVDPPYYQHYLAPHGFEMALAFWGAHDHHHGMLKWGTSGLKMVVDYRKTNVSQQDYFDPPDDQGKKKSRAISCPTFEYHNYHYFDADSGAMRKCMCNARQPILNCDGVPQSVNPPPDEAVRGVTDRGTIVPDVRLASNETTRWPVSRAAN